MRFIPFLVGHTATDETPPAEAPWFGRTRRNARSGDAHAGSSGFAHDGQDRRWRCRQPPPRPRQACPSVGGSGSCRRRTLISPNMLVSSLAGTSTCHVDCPGARHPRNGRTARFRHGYAPTASAAARGCFRSGLVLRPKPLHGLRALRRSLEIGELSRVDGDRLDECAGTGRLAHDGGRGLPKAGKRAPR